MTRKTEIRTKISGVTHDDPHTGINRQRIIKKYIRRGTKLIPKCEPDNPYDANAVGLWLKRKKFPGLKTRWHHIGYLNQKRARQCTDFMKQGYVPKVKVTEVTGGRRRKRTRGVNIIITVKQSR